MLSSIVSCQSRIWIQRHPAIWPLAGCRLNFNRARLWRYNVLYIFKGSFPTAVRHPHSTISAARYLSPCDSAPRAGTRTRDPPVQGQRKHPAPGPATSPTRQAEAGAAIQQHLTRTHQRRISLRPCPTASPHRHRKESAGQRRHESSCIMNPNRDNVRVHTNYAVLLCSDASSAAGVSRVACPPARTLAPQPLTPGPAVRLPYISNINDTNKHKQ